MKKIKRMIMNRKNKRCRRAREKNAMGNRVRMMLSEEKVK